MSLVSKFGRTRTQDQSLASKFDPNRTQCESHGSPGTPGVGHHLGITMKPPSRARAALVKPQVPPTQGNRTSCDQPRLPPPGASPGAGIPVRFYVCVRMYTCKSKAGTRPATHFHLSSPALLCRTCWPGGTTPANISAFGLGSPSLCRTPRSPHGVRHIRAARLMRPSLSSLHPPLVL